MSEKPQILHIDTDYVTKILKMTADEQKEWLSIILDYIKENNLEDNFIDAVKKVLSESTIKDIQHWYNRQNKL